MSKEENIDDLLAQFKDHDEQQAKIREKIKASAVGEVEAIKDKINNISSLSGISKFDLLGITKEEAIKHFGIKQKTDNKQQKRTPSADDIKVREYLIKNPTKKFNRKGGKTYTYQKGPVPNDVRQMILEEIAGIAPE